MSEVAISITDNLINTLTSVIQLYSLLIDIAIPVIIARYFMEKEGIYKPTKTFTQEAQKPKNVENVY